ncbi:MAG: type II secretion system F family protein, partial [Actinomycetota bacterium]
GRQRRRSIGDLHRWMQERDLVPISVAAVESRWHVEITPARTKRKVLVHFTRQLGVFVRSGIPVVEALRVQYEECEDRALRRALGDMIDDIVRGETLSGAAARHPKVFPHYFIGLLRAAERTGRLDEALQNLSEYLQRDIDTRATIVGALAYPCIVVVLSVVTVAVLTGYVLPQFQPLFAELDAELPAPTRLLLGASDFVTDRALILTGAFGGLVVAGIWSAISAMGRRAIDRWLLRVPVGRQVVQFVILERFCRILSTLVQAGIPLPDGLSIGAESTRNTEVHRRLAVARSEMERGRGFTAPLVDTGLFP